MVSSVSLKFKERFVSFYGGFWRGTITLWRVLRGFQAPFRQGNKSDSNHHSTLSQQTCCRENAFFLPLVSSKHKNEKKKNQRPCIHLWRETNLLSHHPASPWGHLSATSSCSCFCPVWLLVSGYEGTAMRSASVTAQFPRTSKGKPSVAEIHLL